jgi:hypothetical protein
MGVGGVWRRWRVQRRASRLMSPAQRAVSRRGITLGSSQAGRSVAGGRFPESARLSAQASVRSALARRGR